MGWRTADAGFFFDSMEMIAALSTSTGGFDRLRGGIELIFADRDRVNDHMAWLCARVDAAFRTSVDRPTTVDAYRFLMTTYVFEIVNRWSLIADIKTVNRLQAWFYAGFGLGRARTGLRGIGLFDRCFPIVGDTLPLNQMPENLRRMLAEASKQMEVAAAEDDFSAVRPLLTECVARVRGAALHTMRAPADLVWTEALADDVEFLRDTQHKMALDVARLSLDP